VNALESSSSGGFVGILFFFIVLFDEVRLEQFPVTFFFFEVFPCFLVITRENG
jgi:hypothetical protein